ncbi:MAG: citrate synthase [Bacilli bacterium]
MDVVIVNGLDDVVAVQSEVSLVDGERGQLIYRGMRAEDVASQHTFEEAAYLIWHGRLPSSREQAKLRAALTEQRDLPPHLQTIIAALPEETGIMDTLRTAVSALGTGMTFPTAMNDVVSVTAKVPTVIAHWLARKRGIAPTPAPPGIGHVEYFLYALHGELPSQAHADALSAYWILSMEHGMNASTFAARVTASTQTDLASALCAAIGAMKGPLHGGAPAEVFAMLDEIGDANKAESWLRDKLDRKERLMGFGHRIYRTYDPRAAALRAAVRKYAAEDPWFSLAERVETTALALLKEYKPQRPLYTNIEYYAAAVMRALQIPKELYTATFTASRIVGWCAHILEQEAHNRLIRPQSTYDGPLPKPLSQSQPAVCDA